MNRRFSGKLLAVLISLVALLCTVSAKDYSVTAGNWQVDFKSNDTLYTDVDDSNDYYMIWVKEDPGLTTRSSSITLFEFDAPVPYGKESLKGWISLLLSSMNKTPTMSYYTIDNTDAVIAEGWVDKFGRIVHAAMYPIDKNSYDSAQRAVGFISLLDKKTNFEILDSLHVEYSDSPLASQTPAYTTTNNRVNQGRSTITTDDLLTAVKQVEPSIDKISMVIGPTNIDVTFTQREGSTKNENINALAVILRMYAYILKLDPTYNGYLRISQAEKGRAIATYEATAYQTRSNIDKAGLLSIDYMNQVLSRGKSITYYMSDGYGDVTKAVEVPGGRAGPSQGSWL